VDLDAANHREIATELLPRIGRLKTMPPRWVPLVSSYEPVSWPGPKWVGLLGRSGGLRPGKLPLFFCFVFFSIFSVFNFEFPI
jgi:hypothetical protein